MLTQTTMEGRALCMRDSVRKEIRVHVYDKSRNLNAEHARQAVIDDSNIISESFEFEDGIIAANVFKYDEAVGKQASLTRIYDGNNYKEHLCLVELRIYNDNDECTDQFRLLEGIITEDTISEDGQTSRMTMLDFLALLQDVEMSSFFPASVTTLGDMLSSTLQQAALHVYLNIGGTDYELESSTAIAAHPALSYSVPSLRETSIKLGELLRYASEVTLCSVHIPTDYIASYADLSSWQFFAAFEFKAIDVSWSALYPSTVTFPSTSTYPGISSTMEMEVIPWYIGFKYSSGESLNYNAVYLRSGQNVLASSKTSGLVGTEEVCYEIVDNVLATSFSAAQRNSLCDTIRAELYNARLVSARLEALWLPYVQPGDGLLITSEEKTFYMPITRVSVRGINLLRATYESVGETS